MQDLVERLALRLERDGLRLATAESCTGGLLAAALTARPNASCIFERGFVTYSNESKIELLGVLPDIIEHHGAVSAETAMAMAEGALKNAQAALALSITGIAGPGGGSAQKPVGLVYFGFAHEGMKTDFLEKHFHGSRDDVRNSATRAALEYLIQKLG